MCLNRTILVRFFCIFDLNIKTMELRANELRIGNYVNYRDKERILIVSNLGSFRFETICHNTGVIYGSDDDSEYNGIPLTEEWLLKFGFQKGGSEWIVSTKESTFIIEQKDDKFYYTGGEGCELSRYFDKVHELQNLYFALTGEELSIK